MLSILQIVFSKNSQGYYHYRFAYASISVQITYCYIGSWYFERRMAMKFWRMYKKLLCFSVDSPVPSHCINDNLLHSRNCFLKKKGEIARKLIWKINSNLWPCVVVLAVTELISVLQQKTILFATIAVMVLHFGFVIKAVLITHWCFSWWWLVLAESRTFVLLMLPCQEVV